MILVVVSCNAQENNSTKGNTSAVMTVKQESLKNEKIREYKFLEGMYTDNYFPRNLVDKVKQILLECCLNIERKQPQNLEELYKLSREATEKINDLADEFARNQSEIETGAREVIAMDFDFIARSYGFKADVEELISNRDW